MRGNPSARARRKLEAAAQYHRQYRAAIRKSDWKKALFETADMLSAATVARVYAQIDGDSDTERHAGEYLHEAGEMFAHIAKELS